MPGHPAVRAEVDTLLKALGNAGAFMAAPAAPAGETGDYSDPITEGEGTVIGPYTLREQIGEGGMGLVFVAEQLQPVRRKVALKVIKPGMDTRQVVARFEAERQALALMDHPNIAKVFDAGTTDTGRPYFVMELVKGVPITEYCDANQPDPEGAAGAVRAGVQRGAARPPEGRHPPRPEAVECAGRRRTTASRCRR